MAKASSSKNNTTKPTEATTVTPKRVKKELPAPLASKLKNTQVVIKAATSIYKAVAPLTQEQRTEAWAMVNEAETSN